MKDWIYTHCGRWVPSEFYIDAFVDANDILEMRIELNLIRFEDAFEILDFDFHHLFIYMDLS